MRGTNTLTIFFPQKPLNNSSWHVFMLLAAWFGSSCGEEDRLSTTQRHGIARAAHGLPVSGMCPGRVLLPTGPAAHVTTLSLEQQHEQQRGCLECPSQNSLFAMTPVWLSAPPATLPQSCVSSPPLCLLVLEAFNQWEWVQKAFSWQLRATGQGLLCVQLCWSPGAERCVQAELISPCLPCRAEARGRLEESTLNGVEVLKDLSERG